MEKDRPPGAVVLRRRRRDWQHLSRSPRWSPTQPAVWDQLGKNIHYVQSDFTNPDGYKKLAETLDKIDETNGTMGNRLFYLSTNPDGLSADARLEPAKRHIDLIRAGVSVRSLAWTR